MPSLPNQHKSSIIRRHRLSTWCRVLGKFFCFVLAAAPAFVLPVALVTKVEDKQTLPVLSLALLTSTVSIVVLARFFRPLIISTLDQHASSH